MSLVDSGIDLEDVNAGIASGKDKLRVNARSLLDVRKKALALGLESAKVPELEEQVRQLSALFDTELVKQQEAWKKEGVRLKRVVDGVKALIAPELKPPSLAAGELMPANADVFVSASAVLAQLEETVSSSTAAILTAITLAQVDLDAVHADWLGRQAGFTKKLDEELEKGNPGASLTSLRGQLERLQTAFLAAQAARDEVGHGVARRPAGVPA